QPDGALHRAVGPGRSGPAGSDVAPAATGLRQCAGMDDQDEVHLLLIEDDAVLAHMYRGKLEKDGYTVRVAGDGEEALRLVAERMPDLIFLDIRLPRMDGLAFLELLRQSQSTRNVPVVIVSNY